MIDHSVFEHKKVALFTLGCKLNFSETSAIGQTLVQAGFERIRFGESADVLVVNTCSVTDLADKKCRQAIKKAIKSNPNAYVVVTGCYAQLSPEKVAAIPGVDLVLGANEKFELLSYLSDLKKKDSSAIFTNNTKRIDKFYPTYSHADRTRCFLKIQDGCDYFCSYCTIPHARGRSRSMPIANTIAHTKLAIAEGAKEIILTGVNIGDFGTGTPETFFDLLLAFDVEIDVPRIRVGSVEPNLMTDEIINLIKQSRKIVPHFHIPLQSGSDEVLRLMKRRYDTALFRQRIEAIVAAIPDAFIGIDVIVGMNGETDALFEETHQFLKSLPFAQLHVFTYSERPGTKALDIEGIVPSQIRKNRSKILLNLSEERTKAFYQQFVGTERSVLFETENIEGMLHGFTDNYIKVVTEFDEDLKNRVVTTLLEKLSQNNEALVGIVNKKDNGL